MREWPLAKAVTNSFSGVRRGVSYLIEEKKPVLAYRLFRDLIAEPLPGLVITRQYPDRVRLEQDLLTMRILWLSFTPGEDSHDPTAIGTLSEAISRFIDNQNGEAVVLLDGLEYLVVNNGFLQTLMFVEHVNEFVMRRKAVVLIPVAPEALTEKERALLKRNLEVLPETKNRRVIRFIPKNPEFLDEAQRLRTGFGHVSCDIDDSPKPFDDRIHEAQALRIPFVVLVSGGEVESGILHVILWTGSESWMSVEGLRGAIRDWHAES